MNISTVIHSLDITLSPFEPGWVWLVGAGPGDPGLLTLHAWHALQKADVIVYDALIDERILNMAAAHSQKIYAGKRGGKPSLKQVDISLKLVKLAQENKRVLRLKGGDPFVFGRGGEEALTLVEHHIPFRVVPGITAGIAGPAYAGIPITHRQTNSSVTFITGYGATGDIPDEMNWKALAQSNGVLVFYMVVKHLKKICGLLVDMGRCAQTSVALVSRATTPDQKILRSSLGEVGDRAQQLKIEPPAILIVGDVVDLRDTLSWWTPCDMFEENMS